MQFEGENVDFSHSFGISSSYSPSCEAGISWQKGIAEEICLPHGSEEVDPAEKSQRDQEWLTTRVYPSTLCS